MGPSNPGPIQYEAMKGAAARALERDEQGASCPGASRVKALPPSGPTLSYCQGSRPMPQWKVAVFGSGYQISPQTQALTGHRSRARFRPAAANTAAVVIGSWSGEGRGGD